MEDQKETLASGSGCLVRFYWMLLGNILLFILLVLIFEKRAKFPSWLDAAFWIAVGSLIGVRYVDIRYLNGYTGDGKPATMRHWRRHAMIVGPVALAAWILAVVLGHFAR